MKVLKGKVVSGIGDFAYWIQKLEAWYTKKTGIALFPGTLNIELEFPYDLPANTIRLEKEEYGGTVSISMQPCTIFGHPSFILRTDKNAAGLGIHGLHIIEVASAIKFGDVYGLKDGDMVEVILG
ncbi:DUF120 domain-containing protein [Mucilaginibacter sp. X4EP1]|uniref:CTP-dependent riboflavin kinase n=1 Tax=Mucilaginibacter sp. X4EP1 TaxID=2723092 RepID=UPI002167C41F|nr:CTP-dependent riboflavin kinase [Mucilaginibacter sp. X4EP1]MCS3815533.1 riboflavin kinase [Mucilaginibacter sp. X4EP1]